MRNDFAVYEEKNIWGKTIYRVRTGGHRGDVITNAYNRKDAEEFARCLNIDPWFFERGDTVADRNKTG